MTFVYTSSATGEGLDVFVEEAGARLQRGQLDGEHKVGRVTGGGEQAGAQQRLVHGATVDTLGGELAVNLREEPDRREDAVQLLAWAHPRLRVSHAAPSRRTVERLEWDSCQIDKI